MQGVRVSTLDPTVYELRRAPGGHAVAADGEPGAAAKALQPLQECGMLLVLPGQPCGYGVMFKRLNEPLAELICSCGGGGWV